MDTTDNMRVITVDISGAFLRGDWPHDQHPGYIMFGEVTVDMICEINSAFRDMIIWSKEGKKKYLYG